VLAELWLMCIPFKERDARLVPKHQLKVVPAPCVVLIVQKTIFRHQNSKQRLERLYYSIITLILQ
jgi:hypothetical protein